MDSLRQVKLMAADVTETQEERETIQSSGGMEPSPFIQLVYLSKS